eukprot:808115-Rhodomonas_salina.1
MAYGRGQVRVRVHAYCHDIGVINNPLPPGHVPASSQRLFAAPLRSASSQRLFAAPPQRIFTQRILTPDNACSRGGSWLLTMSLGRQCLVPLCLLALKVRKGPQVPPRAAGGPELEGPTASIVLGITRLHCAQQHTSIVPGTPRRHSTQHIASTAPGNTLPLYPARPPFRWQPSRGLVRRLTCIWQDTYGVKMPEGLLGLYEQLGE